mgnify:FL=1
MIDAKRMNLNELSIATRENLRSLGYGDRTIYMVNSIWRDLGQFLGSRSKSPFLPVYGLEYLHERIGYPECLQWKLTPDERDYIRAVRMLTSFQESGEVPKALRRNRNVWYEPVKDIRNHYIQHCEEIYKTHATQRSRIAAADRFMRIVVVNKQTTWEDISTKTISEYATGLAEYSKATVEVHLRGLRFFLRFLYEEGIIKQDHTASVPKMCCSTGERIPHMLSTEQVNTLLKSIDRGNTVGKRNYAIIVMAACLGMRDSDITNLKFENINWERSEISFFQKKTNRFLALPLLPVVGEAIIDYLRNGRPQTDSKYVFVKHRPPFQQTVSFYSVMRVVLENSGVKLAENFPKGLHILRHSLASELIRQGESYNTVSTILGHASIGSTNAYTHIDIDGLFKCALELTEATGHEF